MEIATILCVLNEEERGDFLPLDLWSGVEELGRPLQHLLTPLPEGRSFSERLIESKVEILLSGWSTPALPADLPVGGEGQLRYVCHLTGSVKKQIPRELIERGLRVTNWGNSASRTVAECGLLLILSALRRSSHWAVAMHRDGLWKDRYHVVTESLFERSVGLHGFGAVARELALLLQPFACRISTHSPGVGDDILARYGVKMAASPEELFSSNDIIVEAAALTPQTYRMVDEKLLRCIKPGGVFVNIGRGAVVDEAALARVAAEKQIQVALDVYDVEPLPVESPLRGLPNVTLLPHIAGPTKDRRRDCGRAALNNLSRFLKNEPLESEVTLEVYDSIT